MKNNIRFSGDFIHESIFKVRTSDMFLGVHLGNDRVLTLMTEAHSNFLTDKGYSFGNVNNHSCFVKDIQISYKKGVSYKDILSIKIGIQNISKYRLTLYFENQNQNGNVCQVAFIDWVYINNDTKKVSPIDDNILNIYRG